MELMAHEWIENFTEYEAVLRCLNPLSAWDKEATVRAFQTFEWNHASAPGGELEFAHQNTPVVVRFDGAIVAILFGSGKLNEAVPDLFAVLNSLGWHLAEVYHPAESLAGLLSDFGKAIPANMDFDVKPAKSAQKISDFAEVPLLVAQVHNALKGGGGNANDIILEEMLLMDLPPAPAGGPTVTPSSGAFASMVLEDDVAELESSEVVVAAVTDLPSSPSLARPEGRPAVGLTNPQSAPIDHDDFQPRVFSVSGAGAASGHPVMEAVADGAGRSTNDVADEHAQTQADLVIENERLRDALFTAQERVLVVEEEIVGLTQAQEQATLLTQGFSEEREAAQSQWLATLQANTNLQNAVLVAEKIAAECVQANSALVLENERLQFIRDETTDAPANDGVKVGLSAFCFDLPSAPFSDDDAARLAELYGTQEVIHLSPGATGGSLRWAVLDEIESEYPWYAEKMVEAMGFSGAESMAICKLLLDLKRLNPFAQLRDLLTDAGPDAIGQRIGQRLGPLLLCPSGQAFVDLPPPVADVMDVSVFVEVFTVRSVLQSSSARLFVVHVDALDGPFVVWMAELLRFVVQGHAVSKRNSQVIRVDDGQATKSKEIGLAQEKIVAEATGVVDDLIARLEKLRNLDC